jgi:ABC-type lipoprotein export system ATPase subunit
MSAMVTLHAVHKTFEASRGEVAVLNGIDLTIGAGEFVAVMGPSGCGKSTLLSLIGLLDAPTSGSIRIAGEDTGRLRERARAEFRSQRIGFVFQFPSLVSTLNVQENVWLPQLLVGRVTEGSRRRADELLAEVGLPGRGDERSFRLSGGEQRRVALARALMNDPDLLLADEPTGALDEKTAQEIAGLLQKIHSGGKTVVMVTHDRAIAEKADRLLMLRDGVMSE